MAEIKVLGIYEVSLWHRELREDLRQYYFFGNAQSDTNNSVIEYVERCIPLVLFDLFIDGADEHFELANFTQEMTAAPRKAWQAAFDEALLSPIGYEVIARKIGCTKGLRVGRIAFYFHFYDPLKPMEWTYGEFSCPAVQPIPSSLFEIMPYEPVTREPVKAWPQMSPN